MIMMMNETKLIQAALEQHLPRDDEDEDDALREYLLGILQDEDAYEDEDLLIQTIQPFLDDNRQVAENLVQTIIVRKSSNALEKTSHASSSKDDANHSKAASNPARDVSPFQSSSSSGAYGTATATDATQQMECDEASSSPNNEEKKNLRSGHESILREKPQIPQESTPESATSAVTNKNASDKKNSKVSTRRSERRSNKKEQRKANKTSSKNDTSNSNDNNNLQDTVTRIQAESAQALEDMDDYSSAWQAVQDKDVGVWGGRGCGGRGVNRGLAVHRGRDAVVQQLTLSYGGGENLLHETHLVIAHGHRYGLMGPNGCGKSTLLRRIASGSVPGWPRHLSVAMVEQEVLGRPVTARQALLEADRQGNSRNNNHNSNDDEITALEAILEDPSASPASMEAAAERLSEIYDDQDASDDSPNDDQGGQQLDKRARTILKGLQFSEAQLDIPGQLLSGGWRMRQALAVALYTQPDILLLDEPTNHLDLAAILFLQDYLVTQGMTVVVVSHDGHFLDDVCTDMILFEGNQKLRYHVGNYSSLREMLEQTWERNSKKADAAARQEKKTLEFIHKQRSMSNSKHRDDNKQRQAAERQRKLGRIGLYSENGQKFKLLAEGNTKRGGSNRAGHIFGNYTNRRGMTSAFVSNEKVAFAEDHQLLNFKFPAAAPLKGGGSGLITVEDGKFRYQESPKVNNGGDDWLLRDLSLNISHKSRIAIVGKNGAGKSTLLKLLCGELRLNRGEYHRHPNLKVAHIAQHHIEHLGDFLHLMPVEYFRQQHGAQSEQEARQFLGGFGLVGSLALQPIGTLSGGQKARLAFATVMYTAPHLLILDEPTNHLDADSLASLAQAVQQFQGPVLLVSHNQSFLSSSATELWTVADGRVRVQIPDGQVTTFDDLFDAYKESLRTKKKTTTRSKGRR